MLSPALKKKLGLAVLLVGVLVVLPRLLGEKPVAVELRYHFTEPENLQQMEVLFHSEDAQSFSRFWAKVDSKTVVQRTHLPEGAVELAITLTARDGQESELRRPIQVEPDAVIDLKF